MRIIQYGHRVAEGMIRNAVGANVQPLRVNEHEPTCIACSRQTP